MKKALSIIQDYWNKFKSHIEKPLDTFFNNKIVYIVGLYIISILGFYIFSDKINSLIEKYFTIEESSLFQTPKVLFVILFGVLFIFVFYKLIVKSYQLSSTIIYTIISCCILYLITRGTSYRKGWSYISFNEGKLKYIDFVGILLVIATLITLLTEIIRIYRKKSYNKGNVFVSDDPIISNNQDKLEYEKRVSYTLSYIDKAYFEKSFTVGIVGPWGNGKSSFIALVEEKLKKEPLKDTIYLKFLPYLNHSEKDIISEFFKQLSLEIKKYSGKLSNEFLSYSDKLLKLYKDKNIFDFLKPTTGSKSDVSAYDLYNNINKTLESLDKKYIIFIDDLDRLSSNEILQILKLVRNTANFKNFIFFIALDKDYMLDTLMSKNDINDHSYVNKFFQLEIYLPEINRTQLKSDFIFLLKESPLQQHQEFITAVATSIYKRENLFDDYISNYRDVKRLVNQLIFDYSLLPDKLDVNDFLNFTYLKMTFPFAIKYLNRNWQTIIPYNPDTRLYELKEKNENDSIDVDLFYKMRMLENDSYNDPDYSKYEISSDIEKPKEISKVTKFTYTQNLLLSKTLIYLFGTEKSDVDYTSIKFENNFRKLIQQKILDTDLDEDTFNTIFNLDNNFENLKSVLSKNHLNEILNRIEYYNTNEQENAERITIILLYIFDITESYRTSAVWDLLMKFIERSIKHNSIDKKALWDNIHRNFIEKNDFKIEKKIRFLALISENRIRLHPDDWGTVEKSLKDLSLELYKEYIKSKQKNLWDIGDYSFYHTYHNVRRFHPEEVVNPIAIEFWENKDISLLCSQVTENDSWTTKMLRTSDFATQLFGSKKEYQKFISQNLPNPLTPDLKEYINFLEIESYTNFSDYIRFEFMDFSYLKEKLQIVKDNNNLINDEFENIVEIVLKSDVKLGDLMRTGININNITGFVSLRGYEIEKIYYLFIKLKTEVYHKTIPELFKHYQNLLAKRNIKTEIELNKKIISDEYGEKVIEIISVQPKKYDK